MTSSGLISRTFCRTDGGEDGRGEANLNGDSQGRAQPLWIRRLVLGQQPGLYQSLGQPQGHLGSCQEQAEFAATTTSALARGGCCASGWHHGQRLNMGCHHQSRTHPSHQLASDVAFQMTVPY